MVTTAQYIPRGMLVNPLASPSMRYSNAPMTTAIDITSVKKTVILARLACIAVLSTRASLR